MNCSCYLYLAAMTMMLNGNPASDAHENVKTLFSFDRAGEVSRWYAINDGVMGGVSTGGVEQTARGTMRFVGAVSLENNGGFASIRSRPSEMDLSDYAGILVRVRGDGQTYALNLQTDVRIRAGSYRMKFETTPGEWIEVFFPFAGFRATSFGIELQNAPPLNLAKIRSFGLLISDKQAGPFALEVDWIRAVVNGPQN